MTKYPKVVCIKKAELNKRGIDNFADWQSKKKSIYIGRNMSFYIKGAVGSKWSNPFTVKKYGRRKCLKLYKQYIEKSDLYYQLHELSGKELGCFCLENEDCHGKMLIELMKEFDKKDLVRKIRKN